MQHTMLSMEMLLFTNLNVRVRFLPLKYSLTSIFVQFLLMFFKSSHTTSPEVRSLSLHSLLQTLSDTNLVQKIGVLHRELLLGGVEVAQGAVGLLQLGVEVVELILKTLGLLLLDGLQVRSGQPTQFLGRCRVSDIGNLNEKHHEIRFL